MQVQKTIEAKLIRDFNPEHLDIFNESDQHSVPARSETHFKVVIVSQLFLELPLVKRHQLVYQCLQQELQKPVHALALHTYTPSEWGKSNKEAATSPPCMNR